MIRPIKRGNTVRIKTEWRDPGDADFTWIALEDEDGDRVRIAPIMEDTQFPPSYVVTTTMIERAD